MNNYREESRKQSGDELTVEQLKSSLAQERRVSERLARSNASLRGHIGRLKARLEAFEADGMAEF